LHKANTRTDFCFLKTASISFKLKLQYWTNATDDT